MRLIGPISYPGECDLMVHLFNGSPASFSDECILLPSYVYNMHQDTKSARLIAVCKRTKVPIGDFADVASASFFEGTGEFHSK